MGPTKVFFCLNILLSALNLAIGLTSGSILSLLIGALCAYGAYVDAKMLGYL